MLLTTLSRALLEKLILAQPVKKFPASVEPEGLYHVHTSLSLPYAELDESGTNLPTLLP
jgi:hypothetical protein